MSPPEVETTEPEDSHVPPPEPEEEEAELRFDPPKKPKYVAPSPPAYSPKRIETLEDLYHYFPDVGDGSYKVRIKRVAPKNYGGHIIAGWLGDLDEKISIDEFKVQFGGGRYLVCIMGPPKGRSADGETYPIKQLTSDIEIMIPGPPAHGSFPMNQEDMAMSQGMMGTRSGYMEPPAVTMKRLDLDEKERERQRQMQERSSTTPEHIVRAMQEQSESRAKEIRLMSDSRNDLLREQNQALLKAIENKDVEIRSLREDLLKARTDANEAVRRAESTLEQRLKESHDKMIEALKEGHNREYRDVKEQTTKEVRELETRYRERLDEANRNYNSELTRRENDARMERERLVRDNERSEKSLKDSYDQRITDLVRTTEREIGTIREQRDRELASLKVQYESTSKSSETTAQFKIEMSKEELNRLRVEVEALRLENGRLLKASIKDPVTFLTETRTVATELLGMIPADEAKSAGDEGPFDWKKQLAKAAMNIVEKLPETAKGVAESVSQARQQNQQNALAAQQMAAAQGGQNVPRGLPPGAQQPQRRRMAPPPQTWQGTPPAYVGPVTGAELPFQNPFTPLPHHQQQMQQAQQFQSPLQQQFQVPAEQQQIQPQPQASQPPPPPQQQQQQQQQMSEEQSKAVQDGIARFIGELNEAYKGDIISAPMFARAFVDQIGKEQALSWLNQIDADQFLAELDKTGQDVALLEIDGRKYVKTVWAEARKYAGG